MRILLVLLAVVGALVAAGFWFVPILIAQAPAVIGFLGLLFLIVAACWRSAPPCSGLHCSGCKNH